MDPPSFTIIVPVVDGVLTIHGIEQKITTTATIIVKDGGSISTSSEFSVKLADYKVDGPAVGAGKVSREPKITVTAEFN